MLINVGSKSFEELNKEIRHTLETDKNIVLNDVNGQRYIGCAMDAGNSIIINGTPGNDLAAYMNGGYIEVVGNGQDAVGNTMNGGKIIIHGNTGDAAGYAMRAGEIYVKGNSGYRCGIHMKQYKDARPVIVIGGKAGSFLGEYMAGGIIIVLGLEAERGIYDESIAPMGSHCGTGIHGGVMYIRGDAPKNLLGREVVVEKCSDSDYDIIRLYVNNYCNYFAADQASIMNHEFLKLRAVSGRPYGNMYTSN